MKTVLLAAAAIGLAISGAGACEYMKSVKADTVDTTTVASIAVPQSQPVALPEQPTVQPQPVAE